MTPRERWLTILAGGTPDRIPTDYWATDEVTARLLKELGCRDQEELYVRLNIDGVYTVFPERTVRHHPDDPEADHWGVRRRPVEYGTGSYEEFANHPLEKMESAREIDAFRWPQAGDHDFEKFRQDLKRAPSHRLIRSGEYEPFLLYCAMRGMEQAMVDLLVEPEIVTAGLQHIFDYYYELNSRIFEIGKGIVDIFYLAEDLGGQSSLLFGIDQIRRFIIPNQKRMADLARKYGVHVFYHTDGAARGILPDLIDVVGIEVLNPIQWRCPGMEREGLVRDFGKSVIFHGGMDNQQTLPFGSRDEVRTEVLENIRIFENARWICAPCHNLQPVTPTANIVTMYETIFEHGVQT
jgi:uroporphyrinogen decarboxylase